MCLVTDPSEEDSIGLASEPLSYPTLAKLGWGTQVQSLIDDGGYSSSSSTGRLALARIYAEGAPKKTAGETLKRRLSRAM
jgi:hypothetical protein